MDAIESNDGHGHDTLMLGSCHGVFVAESVNMSEYLGGIRVVSYLAVLIAALEGIILLSLSQF